MTESLVLLLPDFGESNIALQGVGGGGRETKEKIVYHIAMADRTRRLTAVVACAAQTESTTPYGVMVAKSSLGLDRKRGVTHASRTFQAGCHDEPLPQRCHHGTPHHGQAPHA